MNKKFLSSAGNKNYGMQDNETQISKKMYLTITSMIDIKTAPSRVN
jgi:hypothetical protein